MLKAKWSKKKDSSKFVICANSKVISHTPRYICSNSHFNWIYSTFSIF
jgi:hypothetical protein